MARQKATRTGHQGRQRSLLEYDTVRSSKPETRRSHRSQAKVQKGRSEDNEAENEERNKHNENTKLTRENRNRLNGKGKEREDKRLKRSRSESASRSPSATLITSGSENESQAPVKKSTRAVRRKLQVAESDTEIEVLTSTTKPEDKNEDRAVSFSSRRTTTKKQRSLLEYATPRKEGDQMKRVKTQFRIRESGSESDSPRKFRFEPRIQSTSASGKRISESPELPSSNLESEDGELSTRDSNPTSRRRLVRKSSSDAGGAISDDSEEDASPPRTQKRRKDVALSDDEEDEVIPSPSKRRRLIRGSRPHSSGELSSEDEQLIEEAEEEESILSSRFRNRSKKNEFVKNLERLKRKKQGQKIEEVEEENESQESSASNSESEVNPLGDDVIPGAKPAHLYKSGEEVSDQDDDFIVEDDEGAVELPPMFNMDTFQDLSHHFKVACQLFVHLSIKKRGERTQFMKQALESTYFSVPLTMSRRKLLSLRDSLVASSIWKTDFRTPLEKYPEFTLERLDFAVPHCDACSLSSRLSTFQGRLRGHKYDNSTYQRKGKEISIDWNLGRFCAARAQVFHRLTHWEYSLFQALDTHINSLRKKLRGQDVENRGGIFIPATRGPPPPDDPDDADGWMEWLDGRGIIEAEWREIKNVMDRAHNLEAKGRGNDDDVE